MDSKHGFPKYIFNTFLGTNTCVLLIYFKGIFHQKEISLFLSYV
jgi:hypothetical protein